MSEKRKNDKAIIVVIILMILCIMGIVALFVWNLVGKAQRGWNNNDTVVLVFFAFVALTGPIVIKPSIDYFANNNKSVIILNNDIYRLFLKIEKNKLLKKYEMMVIDRENKKRLYMINKIVQKNNKSVEITMNNIGNYYDNILGSFKGKKCLINSYRLSKLYREIKMNRSIKFEVLFKNVHNGDLIRKYRFPLFEYIIPLLIGFIGLFATIYQALATDNSIQDSLLEYFKLFGIVILFLFVMAVFSSLSFKDRTVEYKKEVLRDLKSINS